MIDRRRILATLAAVGASMPPPKALSKARGAKGGLAGLEKQLAGKITYRGQGDYELLRQFSVWNSRKPKRYPEAIVMAQTPQDVVAAVKLAKARGWKVGVRSGGHSWYAAHLRDKAIQINLSMMQEITVDPVAMIATVSPSTAGDALNTVLQDQHRLMFPSAHGVGVGLGGFVLCGGHGWNARAWGPGCANLVALDVVTAQGELIHASEMENADYLWAARGAGPGYFAAAVRYHLRLHPLPAKIKASHYAYPIEAIDPLLTWLRDQTDGFPPRLEVAVVGKLDAHGAPQISVNATAFTDTDAETDALLDLMEACPVLSQATERRVKFPVQVPWRAETATDTNPTGYRYAIDNCWTSAPSSQLIPLIRDMFTTLPTPKSYVFFSCWGPVQTVPNAAYSVQGDIYLSPVAVYQDAKDDARCEAWVVDSIKRLSGVALGAQMNDENMAADPQRYLSDMASARLEALRALHDPEGRFVSFLKA